MSSDSTFAWCSQLMEMNVFPHLLEGCCNVTRLVLLTSWAYVTNVDFELHWTISLYTVSITQMWYCIHTQATPTHPPSLTSIIHPHTYRTRGRERVRLFAVLNAMTIHLPLNNTAVGHKLVINTGYWAIPGHRLHTTSVTMTPDINKNTSL